MTYRILGVFVPSIFNRKTIQREFISVLEKLGFSFTPDRYQLEIRDPEYELLIADRGQSSYWHRDGGSVRYVVTWASIRPTEIKDKERIIQPADGEIILFNNHEVDHRRPNEISEKRWFTRLPILTPQEKYIPTNLTVVDAGLDWIESRQ